MIEEIRREGQPAVPIWLDVTDPTVEELQELAERYRLHPTLVADCLDPLHLPKHEQNGDVTFLIVRAFDAASDADDTSVQGLTKQVAVFLGNRFLITVHRGDLSFFSPLLRTYRVAPGPVYLLSVMLEVLLAAVETYHVPLEVAETKVHAFEASILTDRRDTAH